MTYYKKLVGEKCYLSPCHIDDAAMWAEWFNDLTVTLPLGDEAYTPSTPTSEREAIEGMIKSKAHIFTIVDLAVDMPLGRCLLFNVDPINRSAMLGIFIGEKTNWGKGYGHEAVKLLLDYGFNLLNLNNVMLGVFSFNERAIRSYQKVGFKEIGRRRQARIVGGQRFDVIFMDILADEFESVYVNQFIKSIY